MDLSLVRQRRAFSWNLLVLSGLLIYGSLYPFHFADRPLRGLPYAFWRTLPLTHAVAFSRDALLNVLVYIPVGLFAWLAAPADQSLKSRIWFAVCYGTGLSLLVEFSQYFDSLRVTSSTDVITNALGSLIGSFAAILLDRGGLVRQAQTGLPALFLLMFLAAHELMYCLPLWANSPPLPRTSPIVIREAALAVGEWLIAAILARQLAPRVWPILFCGMAAIPVLQIVLRRGRFAWSDLAAAVIAFVLAIGPFRRAMDQPQRWRYAALLLLTLRELSPFEFASVSHPFNWYPFQSFFNGDPAQGMIVLLRKLFLYGSVIWLWQERGRRLVIPASAVTAALLVLEWAQTYTPARTAEITDAILAIALSTTILLL